MNSSILLWYQIFRRGKTREKENIRERIRGGEKEKCENGGVGLLSLQRYFTLIYINIYITIIKTKYHHLK